MSGVPPVGTKDFRGTIGHRLRHDTGQERSSERTQVTTGEVLDLDQARAAIDPKVVSA